MCRGQHETYVRLKSQIRPRWSTHPTEVSSTSYLTSFQLLHTSLWSLTGEVALPYLQLCMAPKQAKNYPPMAACWFVWNELWGTALHIQVHTTNSTPMPALIGLVGSRLSPRTEQASGDCDAFSSIKAAAPREVSGMLVGHSRGSYCAYSVDRQRPSTSRANDPSSSPKIKLI